MEDYQEESVVDVPVDAEQESYTQDAEPSDSGETVVTEAVDAPKPDANVGEAIKREVERREAQLKKQYDEQMSSIRQQNSYLEKRARQEGFADVDSYLKAIDEFEQRQQIEQEAQRMGVDPDTYAQYFAPVNQQLTELQQKVQTYEQQMTAQQQQEQSQQQWGELYSAYPNLSETSTAFNEGKQPEWFTPQMQDLVNKGYAPVHAYELAHKDTLFRQKEQEVLARVTGRDGKQVLPSVDSPNNMQFDPENMSFDDIQKISERVRRGERITF